MLLDDGQPYPLEILLAPVDLERPGDGILEPLVTLEHQRGPADPVRRQQRGMRRRHCRVRIGEPLPMRERAGTRDTQRIVGGTADRDGVGDLVAGKRKRLGHAGGYGIGALGGVVEPFVAHRRDVAQPGLHLVRDCKRGKKVGTRGAAHLGRGQHRGKIIGRVAGLARSEIAVHEIKVARERAVKKGCPIRGSLAAADERAQGRPAKLCGQIADSGDRDCIERTDPHRDGVEHADLELIKRLVAEILKAGARDKIRKCVHLGHDGATLRPNCDTGT